MRRLQELAKSINGEVVGAEHAEILGAATIARSTRGDITFACSQKPFEEFLLSDAAAVVAARDIELTDQCNAIIVDDPLESFTAIVAQFRPPVKENLSASALERSLPIQRKSQMASAFTPALL